MSSEFDETLYLAILFLSDQISDRKVFSILSFSYPIKYWLSIIAFLAFILSAVVSSKLILSLNFLFMILKISFITCYRASK